MSGGLSKAEKKRKYFEKLNGLLSQYKRILIVTANNVGSFHFQQIRHALVGLAVIVMGKNTLMRKVIRKLIEETPELENLLPHIKGNIGLVLTNKDLNDVRKRLLENRKPAAAKVGAIAPCDVILEAGPTGMEPTQTSFLQALNIQSKINKGQVEIVSDVHLLKVGQKVGNSEATLLQKLNITPFSYGLEVKMVYDHGAVYEQKILDLTDADILKKFTAGVSRLTAVSLSLGYPTLASVPHSIIRGYKNVAAVSLATEYTFKGTEKLKEYLKNPAAFAVAAAPAAAAPAAAPAKDTKAAPKKEEKKPEPEPAEEEDDDMGFGLFD
jgi:large subunit ribosomal protein LP0